MTGDDIGAVSPFRIYRLPPIREFGHAECTTRQFGVTTEFTKQTLVDPGSRNLGESLYGIPSQQDSSKSNSPTLPEGFEADPVLMSEFNDTARSLRLDKTSYDRLVQLHAKAVQGMQDRHSRQTAAWADEAKAHFGDSLPDTVQNLRAGIGTDDDGRNLCGSWAGRDWATTPPFCACSTDWRGATDMARDRFPWPLMRVAGFRHDRSLAAVSTLWAR